MRTTSAFFTLLAATTLALPVSLRADLKEGMKEGAPDLQSISALAFGPEGILFVADPKAAAVFAIATEPAETKPAAKIENLIGKIAATLGTTEDKIIIEDLAVDDAGTYLSVSRGRGPDAQPALLRLAGDKVELVALDKVHFSRAAITNAPEDKEVGQGRRRRNNRMSSITDMAWTKGRLAVAGLSNEEFASTLRVFDFPFTGKDSSSTVEIYHGAHGSLETHAPIRTLLPLEIDGEMNIVASYTCTPLVRIPLKKIKPAAHIKGDTIAELGNRNRPLDMIQYEKDGKEFILMANSARGIMKIATTDLGTDETLASRVPRGETAGVGYATIDGWENVTQLAKHDATKAAVIKEWIDEASNKKKSAFETVALPLMHKFRLARISIWVLLGALSVIAREAPAGDKPVLRFLISEGAVEAAGIPDTVKEEALIVRLAESTDALPAIAGTRERTANRLRFHPRFGFDPGVPYIATLRVPGRAAVELVFQVPEKKVPAAIVEAVFPSGEKVTENHLRFYVHFSAPMSRGCVAESVTLLNGKGSPVDLPFLLLNDELWNPDQTRLTLFLDPARVKRGLRPREEEGPVLTAGEKYTLEIGKGFLDAEGKPLKTVHQKSFHVGPSDSSRPNPDSWTVSAPEQDGNRDPLNLMFEEALDHGMLHRAVRIFRGDRRIDGHFQVLNGETVLRFVPEKPWKHGAHRIVVDRLLEDPSGNSIDRKFEVTRSSRNVPPQKRRYLSLEFEIGAKEADPEGPQDDE